MAGFVGRLMVSRVAYLAWLFLLGCASEVTTEGVSSSGAGQAGENDARAGNESAGSRNAEEGRAGGRAQGGDAGAPPSENGGSGGSAGRANGGATAGGGSAGSTTRGGAGGEAGGSSPEQGGLDGLGGRSEAGALGSSGSAGSGVAGLGATGGVVEPLHGGVPSQGGELVGEGGAEAGSGTGGQGAGGMPEGGSAGSAGTPGAGGVAPECTVNGDCAHLLEPCVVIEVSCAAGSCVGTPGVCAEMDTAHCRCDTADGCSVQPADKDGDSHGDVSCAVAPGDDCNDDDGTVYPGGALHEICNGIDDDCDGRVDLEQTGSPGGSSGTVIAGYAGLPALGLGPQGTFWLIRPVNVEDGRALSAERVDPRTSLTASPVSVIPVESGYEGRDGSIRVARSGDKLGILWFRTFNSDSEDGDVLFATLDDSGAFEGPLLISDTVDWADHTKLALAARPNGGFMAYTINPGGGNTVSVFMHPIPSTMPATTPAAVATGLVGYSTDGNTYVAATASSDRQVVVAAGESDSDALSRVQFSALDANGTAISFESTGAPYFLVQEGTDTDATYFSDAIAGPSPAGADTDALLGYTFKDENYSDPHSALLPVRAEASGTVALDPILFMAYFRVECILAHRDRHLLFGRAGGEGLSTALAPSAVVMALYDTAGGELTTRNLTESTVLKSPVTALNSELGTLVLWYEEVESTYNVMGHFLPPLLCDP